MGNRNVRQLRKIWREKDRTIFSKRLNKEKPLAKDKDLQPLSVRDFKPAKSSFDMMVEKTADNRRKTGMRPTTGQPGLKETGKRTVYKNPQAKRGARLAERYEDNKKNQGRANAR